MLLYHYLFVEVPVSDSARSGSAKRCERDAAGARRRSLASVGEQTRPDFGASRTKDMAETLCVEN